MTAPAQPIEQPKAGVSAWRPAFIRSVPLRLSVFFICLLWTIPTLGLLVTSVRDPKNITTSGWWTALLHPFEANQWTLSNYQTVIASDGMGNAFINSLIVTIPSVAIPITIAAFAAYAFAWVPFRGRGILFTIVVALLVVPIQMSLIPILQIYTRREPVRLVPRHLAGAHGLRSAAGDLPALQLHLAAAAGPVRVRRDRRRDAPPDVHPPRPAAVDPGARGDRHLPVPVGLERPAGRPRLPGPGCRGARPADGPLQPDRQPRRRMASPHRWCVHHDDRAARRLPAPPACIRSRDPGGLRQVVTLARLMIAFAGTELPPSAARRIRERGVAGVTLFVAHNIVDPPQIRGLTAAIQAARPAGAPAAADRRRPGGRPADRPGRRDDAVRGCDGSRRDRRRRAGRACRRRDGARAACPRCQRRLRAGLRRGEQSRPTRRSGSAASATIPRRSDASLRRPSAACRTKAWQRRSSTSRAPATRQRIRTTSCRSWHRTNAELAARELVPFRAALDAGARMVMTGHFALPGQDGDLPTSLSAAVLRDLLRGQLQFDGVTVTDALDMRALAQGSAQIVDAVTALRAGEDVLLGTAGRGSARSGWRRASRRRSGEA